MKARTKIIIMVLSIVFFMMILPLVAVKFLNSWVSMGLWIFTFFTVNPLLIIVLSIMAGTDLRKLWWFPLAISIAFPLLFGVAIQDFVWDLYIYSAIYLVIGLCTMMGTYLVKRIISKRFGEMY